MTNRELLWCDTCADELGVGRCGDCEGFCARLAAERKAGELDGRIEALEWARDRYSAAEYTDFQHEIDRLRAEKAKLG